jgi:hypothetical protein
MSTFSQTMSQYMLPHTLHAEQNEKAMYKGVVENP